MSARIAEAASLLAANAAASDEELMRMLVERGWHPVAADLAVSFLPIACGRLALFKLGATFPDEFRAKDANGNWVSHRLSDNFAFREAARLAVAVRVHGVLGREDFQAIAVRSPELRLASNALDSGASLAHAAFAPICLLGATAGDVASEEWVAWWTGVYPDAEP